MIGCGGCVINIFTRIGIYIEKHWPEKMTAEEVRTIFQRGIQNQNESIAALYERLNKLEDAVKTLQTQTTVKSRIAGSTPSAMTPFASKFPINGGNQSPR